MANTEKEAARKVLRITNYDGTVLHHLCKYRFELVPIFINFLDHIVINIDRQVLKQLLIIKAGHYEVTFLHRLAEMHSINFVKYYEY